MAEVQDVARFFIGLAEAEALNENGDYMTNLRLQKLLYFAQGEFMARYGKPLFDASFEAWEHGPVCDHVYRLYSAFKRNPIKDGDVSPDHFSAEEYQFLMDFVNVYWKYSTSELYNMSHKDGGPWKDIYDSSIKHIRIEDDAIMRYFQNNHRVVPLRERIGHIPVIEPLRYEDDVPVFAKELRAAWGEWDG